MFYETQNTNTILTNTIHQSSAQPQANSHIPTGLIIYPSIIQHKFPAHYSTRNKQTSI